MDDLKFIISSNLVRLRKHNKLTQGELATHMNYSDKSVSKWETGETTPSIEILKKLADFYNVKVDDLLDKNFTPEKTSTKKERHYSRVIISLLGIMCAWLIAVIAFVFTNVINKTATQPWMLFIFPIPITFILAIIFNAIWGKPVFTYVFISCLTWSILLTFYLSFLAYANLNIWMTFLIGAPIQVIVILWSRIRKR